MRHTFSDAAMSSSPPATTTTSDHENLNAIYDVSHQIMRLSGYTTPTYKWLLSNGACPPSSASSSGRTVSLDLPPISQKSLPVIDEPEQQTLLDNVNENDEIEAITAGDTDEAASNQADQKKDHNVRLRRRVARPQNFYALQKKGNDIYYTRKQLMQQKIRACNWSVALAVSGILLTVLESELAAHGTILKVSG